MGGEGGSIPTTHLAGLVPDMNPPSSTSAYASPKWTFRPALPRRYLVDKAPVEHSGSPDLDRDV